MDYMGRPPGPLRPEPGGRAQIEVPGAAKVRIYLRVLPAPTPPPKGSHPGVYLASRIASASLRSSSSSISRALSLRTVLIRAMDCFTFLILCF